LCLKFFLLEEGCPVARSKRKSLFHAQPMSF
jgi:hypothetical protein